MRTDEGRGAPGATKRRRTAATAAPEEGPGGDGGAPRPTLPPCDGGAPSEAELPADAAPSGPAGDGSATKGAAPGAAPPRRMLPRRDGLAGQVSRIEMQDFMCHKHLVLDLSPNVTFVTGRNGSGKSASLAALQVCLGVQPRHTRRVGKARDLIRTGAKSARVRVTLWNGGAEAFEPAKYGGFITVERNIGTGQTLRLLDEHGSERAAGARAVEALVSHYGARADNPIIVLTQDAARGFAGDASSRERYSFFARAVRLDEIEEHLKGADQHIRDMGASLREMERGIREQEAAMEAKRGRLESARGALHLRERMRLEARALAWGAAADALRDARRAGEAARGTLPERARDAALELERRKSGLDAVRRRIEDSGDELAAVERRQTEAAAMLAKLARSAEQAKDDAAAAERRHRKVVSDREVAERDLKVLRESLVEADAEAAEAAGEERARAAAEAERLEGEADKAEREHRALEAEVKASRASEEGAEGLVTATEAAARAASHAVRIAEESAIEAQRALTLDRAGETNPAAFFGADVARLAGSVARERGRFRAPVLGPIGALVRLREARWCKAADAALTAHFLRAFVVRSHADASELRELARHCNARPQVIVVAHGARSYDLSGLPPPPRGSVVLDQALYYPPGPDGELLRCVLIDHKGVERTLLTPSVQTLRELLAQESAWRRLGVVAAWAADGSKGHRRGGNETVLRPSEREPRVLVEGEGEEARRERALEKAELVRARLEARDGARAAETEARAAVLDARGELARRRQETGRLSSARMRARVVLSDATNAARAARARADPGDDPGDAANPGELLAAQEHLRSAREAEALALDELRAARAASRDVAEGLTVAQRGSVEQAKALEAASRALKRLAAEAEAAGRATDEAAADEREARALVAEGEARARELAKVAEELRRGALTVCTEAEGEAALRVAVGEGVSAEAGGEGSDGASGPEERPALAGLRASLAATRREVEERERRARGSPEELEREVAEGEAALRTKLESRVSATDIHGGLHDSCRRRWREFERVRELVSSNVTRRFNSYLSFRGHRGQVKFDHQRREMRVQVRVSGSTVGIQDLRALSGGERSLTTVCLLLSLGHEGLRPPFQAMDEFDVFMDAANRRFAVAYLLEFAHKFSDRQFIFLTPNDLGVISESKKSLREHKGLDFPSDFPHVVSLAPPRRP